MPDEMLPLPEDKEIIEDIFLKIAEEIFNRVFKIPGKGLSTEDFTTFLLNKLNEIEERANRTIIEDNFDSLESSHAFSAYKGHQLKKIIDDLMNGAQNVDTAEKANKLTNSHNFRISGHGTAGPNIFDGTQDVNLHLELNDSGVKGGTYSKVTVTDKGIITSASQQTADDIPMLTLSKISDAYRKEDKANKGAANGYTPLNETVKIPYQYLPDFILGQKLYAGTVNAATAKAFLSIDAQDKFKTFDTEIILTNDISKLTGYLANNGNYYIVSTAGTFAGIAFDVGDWLVATASGWKKIDNTDAVTGIKGDKETAYRIGNVNITCANVGAEPSVTVGTAAQYWNGVKAWTDFDTSVRGAILTGFESTVTTTVLATDTVLAGVGKLQGQINNRLTAANIIVTASTGISCSVSGNNVTLAGIDATPTVKGVILLGASGGAETFKTAGTTEQYWRGDKSLSSFVTDVLASTITAPTLTDAVIAAGESIQAVAGKLQAQVTAAKTSATAANTNANNRVLKTGDTMTGRLVGADLRGSNIASLTTNAAFYVPENTSVTSQAQGVLAWRTASGDGYAISNLNAVNTSRLIHATKANIDAGTNTTNTVWELQDGKLTILNGTIPTAAAWTTGRTIELTGDITGTSSAWTGSANLSLSTTLANSGVAAGTYKSVTVDAKGRVTAGTNPSTVSGYGITDAVTLTGTQTLTNKTLTSPIIGTSLVANSVTVTAAQLSYLSGVTSAIQPQLNERELSANKGVAGGYAGLDGNTKLLLANMPDFILGQKLYAGTVNISTAVATLTSNAQTKLGTTNATITLTNNTVAITGYLANQGNYYIVSTAGTFAGIAYDVGDWLVATASGWKKIDNTDAVTGIKGNAESTYRIGNVNLTPANIGAVTANTAITGATKTKITYDSKGLVTDGADLALSDLPPSATANRFLKVTAANGTPTYQQISLGTANQDVTGTLQPANGGTGAATIAGQSATQRKVFASPRSTTAAAPSFDTLNAGDVGIRDVSISVPISAWVTSTVHTGFDYQASVTITGLLATNNVNVIFASTSVIIANEAGLMSAGLTAANTLTLYSKTVPTAALSGVVKII